MYKLYVLTAFLSNLSLLISANRLYNVCEENGITFDSSFLKSYIALTVITFIPVVNIILFIICLTNILCTEEELLNGTFSTIEIYEEEEEDEEQ